MIIFLPLLHADGGLQRHRTLNGISVVSEVVNVGLHRKVSGDRDTSSGEVVQLTEKGGLLRADFGGLLRDIIEAAHGVAGVIHKIATTATIIPRLVIVVERTRPNAPRVGQSLELVIVVVHLGLSSRCSIEETRLGTAHRRGDINSVMGVVKRVVAVVG